MAIVSVFGTTAATLTANVSHNLYLIGPNAIIATAGDAVDGANTTTSKRIIVQGALVSEQDGIDLGSGGLGGFNQVQIAPGGSIVAKFDGIEAEGSNNVIVNEGSIFAVNDGIFLLNDGNKVTNYGNITGFDGVDITGNLNIVTNYGRITGRDEGVEIAGNHNQLFNFGDIVSMDDFVGNEAVEVSTSSETGETFSMWNYGRIAGLAAFSGGAGIDLVTNEGAMAGEVRLNQSNDVLNNFGTIDGFVDAGIGDDIVVNRGRISQYVQLGAGNDRFDGRGGEVVGEVRGGADDDTYLIDDPGIVLVELAGQGTDTVGTSVTFALPDHIENLSLIGSGNIDGFGNSLDNLITPNLGANFIDGGDGVDTVSYGQATVGVVAQLFGQVDPAMVNLTSLGSVTAPLLRTAGAGAANGDILVNVENLFGTAFDDILLGSPQNNVLRGQAGNDLLFGHAGDDVLEGGAGADQLNGGGGTDYASYTTAGAGLRADLVVIATNTGDAAGDTYANIQNLRGSLHNDTLLGTFGRNRLEGLDGDDILQGRGGGDTYVGGAGNDTFVFQNGFGAETVLDFDALNDLEKIDLAFVSAITDFTDLVNNHMNISGSDTLILDGLGGVITLAGVAFGNLDANDFIF